MNINRKHKNRLFRLVFQKKEDLLSLYNAVNGSSYKNADELEITTLDDVIYMGMKNDISFMIGSVLNLWEHQSTLNPNLPLRGVLYFSSLYRKYVCQAANYPSRLPQTFRKLNSAVSPYCLSLRAVFYGTFLSALLTRFISSPIVLSYSSCQ